jgi:methylenetetrahydrofolate reductase (NADPH)
VIRRYAARLAEHGVLDRLYILIGIAPLRSAKSARWIKEKLFGAIVPDLVIERIDKAADPVAEGSRIALELIDEISAIRGIAGVHIMAPNNDAIVPGILTKARERVLRKAAV